MTRLAWAVELAGAVALAGPAVAADEPLVVELWPAGQVSGRPRPGAAAVIYRRRSATASSLLRTHSIPGHALNVARLIVGRPDE